MLATCSHSVGTYALPRAARSFINLANTNQHSNIIHVRIKYWTYTFEQKHPGIIYDKYKQWTTLKYIECIYDNVK